MGMGGAELQGLLISSELVKRGYDVSIITFDHDPREIEDNIPFHLIRTYRQGQSPHLLKVMKAVNLADADIYFINNAGYILAPVTFSAHRRGRRVLFWGASDSNFDPCFKWYRMPTYRDKLLYLWGLKRCDAYVVQNRRQQELLLRHFGKLSEVIHNGFYPSDGFSSFEREVLWVGSMRKVKNPRMFLELAKRIPEVRFVMVGGNPLQRDEFRDSIYEEARTIPNLLFKGFLPFEEVERLFKRASLFVNTSTLEGFPNTFLQAWARGVPVLSTVNVNPDGLITENHLGAVVSNLDEMVDAVRRHFSTGLDTSPVAIKAFYDKHLTIGSLVDKMESIFDTLVAS
jgi:glycosyltransferase involved in cell wall biosynthesis